MIVQGYQKLYSNVLKAQIQKYKYKIHKYTNTTEASGYNIAIFSESSWSKDIKTDNTKCLMQKYQNTNTQIHKYSK